jgi:hypothetical protein
MVRPLLFATLAALCACERVPSAGAPLSPLPDAPLPPLPAQAAPEAEPPAAPSDGRFDFDADDRQVPTADPADPLAQQLAQPPPVLAAPPVGAPAPIPPTGLQFGVRLVATLTDALPPRAVLALADGTEVVVEPGTLLPAHHLAVLGVGRDTVDLARIEPAGFYATVEVVQVRALFPASP